MDETTTDPRDLGAALKAAREAAGLTLDEVWIHLVQTVPKPMRMSRGKVQQLEKGATAKVDPFDVEVLATIYGVTVDSLAPDMAEAIRGYRRFVSIDGGAAEGSGCSASAMADAA